MKRFALLVALSTLATPASARSSHYSSLRGKGICHRAVDELVPPGSVNRFFHHKVRVESSDDPGAWHRNRNGSIDRGCLMLNSIHGFAPSCLFEPRCNVRKALVILKRQGRGAWTSP